MSTIDLIFAAFAFLAAIGFLVYSPWHRTVAREALVHPRTEGWIDVEEGRISVQRGTSLADHLLREALTSLEEAQSALEVASHDLQSRTAPAPTTATIAQGGRWSTAAIAASVAAAAGYLSRYLGGKSSNS